MAAVASITPINVRPQTVQDPNSITGKSWLLWRAAKTKAVLSGAPGDGEDRITTAISMRALARDLWTDITDDEISPIYAYLAASGNAKCLERGGGARTPVWNLALEWTSVSEADAAKVKLPKQTERRSAKRRIKTKKSPNQMTRVDQRAAIMRYLGKIEHPVYSADVAQAIGVHSTTAEARLRELIEDEQVFRRHETLDERSGVPGRRHYLYWKSADIPIRSADLFRVTTPGGNPGQQHGPRKSVLERIEAMGPGDMVSLSNASVACKAGVQELLSAGVIEYVNPETQKEVRLTNEQPLQSLTGVVAPPKKTSFGDQIEALIEAEITRRLVVRAENAATLLNEVRAERDAAQNERRQAEATHEELIRQRDTVAAELRDLKAKVAGLLGG